jgi:hypothetical protein
LDDRVRWIATQLDLTAVIWNLDTDDWAANVLAGVTTETVDNTYEDFIKMGTNGTFSTSGNIVLSHEINNKTMELFMKHYPAIKKAYSHVMDVATCMNITTPYAETSVTFPTFEQSLSSSSNNSSASNSSSAHVNSGSTIILNGPLLIAALFGLLFFV